MLARLLTSPISFASQMSFSLLVFDDTAATPVDKPFHAVFPMDVAQVRVSHMRCGCEKFNFILKKVLHPVQSGRYHRDFSHLISPVWAAVPLPVPGKMLNTPQIIRTMILNKLACFTGRKQILLHSAQ